MITTDASLIASRYWMSLGVINVVPGIDTTRARMQPRTISHHCHTRGSMMKMRSPGATPIPARTLAKRRERSLSSAKVKRRGWPSLDTHRSASLAGSRAQVSKVSNAQL